MRSCRGLQITHRSRTRIGHRFLFTCNTLAMHPIHLISGEGLRRDVKYDGSRLRHLSRLLTVIKNLRFLQGQNLLEQLNYDDNDDDDDDQQPLWPSSSYEMDAYDDDSGKGYRRLSTGSRLGTGRNDDFVPRSILKRVPGSCINSCMGRGMSFVRCKSMCN